MKRLLAIVTFWLALSGAVFAVQPDEVLDDPALEARARSISAELRCLVCQNQSIDDSDAELAHDLRVLVRERLVEGDTDAEVFDYVVARYGEFVLLRPVFAWHTLWLWIAAPLALVVGLGFVIAAALRRAGRSGAAEELSEEESAALSRLERENG